jgi:hypothetical protein
MYKCVYYTYMNCMYIRTCMRRLQRLAAQEAGLRYLLPKLRRSKLKKTKYFLKIVFWPYMTEINI